MKPICKFLIKIISVIVVIFTCSVSGYAYDANEELNCNTEELNSAGSAQFAAQWAPISYNISYNLNDGTYGAQHPNNATYDDVFAVSNPIRFGYVFSGWNITGMDASEHTFGSTTNSNTAYTTSETSFKNLTSVDNATVAFSALWDAGTSTVLLKNGETTIDTVSATFSASMPIVNTSNVALSMPTRTKAVFSGYFDAASAGNKYYNSDLTSNRTWDKTGNQTLYAQFNDCECVINSASVATCTATGVNASNQCEYVYTCTTGYTTGEVSETPITSGTFTGAVATASNTAPSCTGVVFYEIKYMDGTNEMTDLYPNQYAIVNGVTLPSATSYFPVSKTGYVFVGWYDNPDLAGTPITGWSAGQTGDKVFYAKWTPNSVMLSYVDADDGSEIDTTPTSCTYDTTFNLPDAPTKEGYRFVGWELIEP